MEGFASQNYSFDHRPDTISNIIEKFENHPSIAKIKENIKIDEYFHFSTVDESMIKEKISSLDKKKPTAFNNIPTRLIVENNDIISPFITEMYNEST